MRSRDYEISSLCILCVCVTMSCKKCFNANRKTAYAWAQFYQECDYQLQLAKKLRDVRNEDPIFDGLKAKFVCFGCNVMVDGQGDYNFSMCPCKKIYHKTCLEKQKKDEKPCSLCGKKI